MDVKKGFPIHITVTLNGSLVADAAGDLTPYDIGDEVSVTVTKQLDQVTGFFNAVLKDVQIDSTVKTRLEQTATYGNLTVADDFKC
jgi:hypothetical protein